MRKQLPSLRANRVCEAMTILSTMLLDAIVSSSVFANLAAAPQWENDTDCTDI
jgi:hypothetical protein